MKQEDNTAILKNRKSKSPVLSSVISSTSNVPDNYFMKQLQEMEELNAHLEMLIEQSKEKLTQVVETNTKFISIIAHDLRGPFCSILAALTLLKEKLDQYNIAEIEKYTNIASNSASRALNLLESLLTWTLSQNKEKSFNPVKINLYKLILDEIENFDILASQKQIMLKLPITPEVNVSADLQMVKTIFRNLISNAIKYTNTGGEITISASENKQFVEIVIKDNGVGISFAAQRELFKIDGFLSTTGTNNEKGAGLGLLLCKEFVEMHGGKIWVVSEPCKGSEFKFTLPHYL